MLPRHDGPEDRAEFFGLSGCHLGDTGGEQPGQRRASRQRRKLRERTNQEMVADAQSSRCAEFRPHAVAPTARWRSILDIVVDDRSLVNQLAGASEVDNVVPIHTQCQAAGNGEARAPRPAAAAQVIPCRLTEPTADPGCIV